MLIGIAGKTGSGKNHIASLLEDRGWRALDLDQVAHQVLELLAEPIEATFGPGILDSRGRVDRKILGSRVFSDPVLLKKLEDITYPRIVRITEDWLSESDAPAVIHAVNLHKTGFPERCDAVLWVWAPQWIRRRRVCARDHRPWSALKGRFRSQKSLKPKLFSHRAETFSVGNFGNPRRLERRLDRILDRV